MSRLLLAVMIVVAWTGCAGAEEPAAGAPAAPSGFDWKFSTPEEQGLDSRVFVDALRRVRQEGIDLHSLIVIRNDHVVLEVYVHPYERESLHNVKSVSKSIISAVTGIALREGWLTSLDQKVFEFFPGYFEADGDPRKKQIALRHLLTMTAGLDLDENGPLMAEVFQSEDWIAATFRQPMIASPGKRFAYSTPLTHTMSGILTEAGGASLLELSRQYLFDPLGFGEVRWRQGPRGYYFGGAELFLRTRDMAKFGLLFLDGGRWGDRQVVPAEWVAESTRNQVESAEASRPYGYWWWTSDDGRFLAMGWGGQAISVEPEIRMVAAGTSADHNMTNKLFRGFDEYEPSDEPLPPNPEAYAALKTLVAELAHPAPVPVPDPPAIAAQVSGRTFDLDPNPLGIEHVTFDFPGGSAASITLDESSGRYELAIGLDGVYRLSDTGARGHMPGETNRFAHRGGWSDKRTFVLESHEMGTPTHARATVKFDGRRIVITFEQRPQRRDIRLTGKSKPEKTE